MAEKAREVKWTGFARENSWFCALFLKQHCHYQFLTNDIFPNPYCRTLLSSAPLVTGWASCLRGHAGHRARLSGRERSEE